MTTGPKPTVMVIVCGALISIINIQSKRLIKMVGC